MLNTKVDGKLTLWGIYLKYKNESRNYYTVTDIKNILKISQSAAYELTHRRDFPVCKFGGTIRIPEDAFWSWVDARTYIPTTLSFAKGVI